MHPFWWTASSIQQSAQQQAASGSGVAGRQMEAAAGQISFPFEYMALFRESIERLRPDFTFAASLVEAAERVAKLEADTLKELGIYE